MFNAEKEIKKWEEVLNHEDVAPIQDSYRRSVTAKLLENTEKALQEERQAVTGSLNENNQTTSSIVGSPFYAKPYCV